MALFAAKAITSSGEPLGNKHYLKIFVACISYANLCFLNAWAEIFGHSWDFMRRYSVTWQSVAALVFDILLLGIILWIVVCLVLRSGNPLLVRILKWCTILALLVPFNVIRTDEAFVSLKQIQIPGTGLRAVIVLAGVAVGILILLMWERFSARVITAVLTLVAPMMALALFAAVNRIGQGPPGGLYVNLPLQAALPQPPDAPRVVWVIFDEWDDYLTFHQRPPGIDLPAIDRFAGESVHATNVTPPARLTIVSVPSLLTGRTFVDAKPRNYQELVLTTESKQEVPFPEQDTIFAAARQLGMNIGIVGWFLPYCRLIPECTVCEWHAGMGIAGRMQYEDPHSVGRLMAQDFNIQVKEVPLLYRLGFEVDTPIHQKLHGRTYNQVHQDMTRALADRRLNLLFIHMSVPHGPMIYTAREEKITSGANLNYADNLRLTDRTVADIRRTLEEAGMWDSSTVLLTSDHPLRVSYYQRRFIPRYAEQHAQVPYLLKMAGEKIGITYNQWMKEIVTKQLLLAILSHEVTTPEQATAWLDAHQAQH
jgi:hypothetical protein